MFVHPASKCEDFEGFLTDLRKTPHSPVLLLLNFDFIAALPVPLHDVVKNGLT